MYRNSVDVKVGAHLRKWVMSVNDGDDVIHLDKRTNLWGIVKQNLDLIPADYQTIQDRSEYISIEILDSHNSKTYNNTAQKSIHLNPLYRCYLSDSAQNAIRRYLENQFKNNFIVFMIARTSIPDSRESISAAVTAFLLEYDLHLDKKAIGRHAKYWYRYRVNHPENNAIPMFF